MDRVLDLTEIQQRYNSGHYTYKPKKIVFYRENHVFDENLSVKRNREMVKEANDKARAEQRHGYDEQAKLDKVFKDNCVDYLVHVYNFKRSTAEYIYNYCYGEKHDSMYEFFWFFDEIAEVVDDCLQRQGVK